jgi:uncharacterized protein YggE
MDNHHSQICKDKKSLCSALCAVLIIFVIVLTIFVLVGIQNKVREGRYIGQEVESRNTISVSGDGEVYAKPDLALTSFSVTTESDTVNKAMQENTEKMNAIINAMKEQGVASKDLKTTNFSLYPRYEWQERAEIYPYQQGERVLAGYEVTQSLQVKIRDLDKAGQIIQTAAEVGANQVGSLQFTIDNQDELKKQAREQAIQEAKTKAKELASQLGVKLIRITSFNEGGVVPRFYAMDEAVSMAGKGGGEVPQIETGESKISVNVNITYEIR